MNSSTVTLPLIRNETVSTDLSGPPRGIGTIRDDNTYDRQVSIKTSGTVSGAREARVCSRIVGAKGIGPPCETVPSTCEPVHAKRHADQGAWAICVLVLFRE